MKKMICVLALFSILLSGCGSNNKKLYEGSFVSSNGERVQMIAALDTEWMETISLNYPKIIMQ